MLGFRPRSRCKQRRTGCITIKLISTPRCETEARSHSSNISVNCQQQVVSPWIWIKHHTDHTVHSRSSLDNSTAVQRTERSALCPAEVIWSDRALPGRGYLITSAGQRFMCLQRGNDRDSRAAGQRSIYMSRGWFGLPHIGRGIQRYRFMEDRYRTVFA